MDTDLIQSLADLQAFKEAQEAELNPSE